MTHITENHATEDHATEDHATEDHATEKESCKMNDIHDKQSVQEHKPRANLYTTQEGWLLVTALPEAKRDALELTTEGARFQLSVPREAGGVYRRTLHFPKSTRWGDLSAYWEGDLLYIDLKQASPERRVISVS